MAESRKFTTNTNTSRVEEFDDLMKGLDKSTNFYWSMTYPSRVAIGDTTINAEDDSVNEQIKQAVHKARTMGGYGPAPSLQPINRRSIGSGDKITKNTQTPSVHVNVRDNHHWTESPISSRREVPMLNLKEQKIMTNVAINQLINMGTAVAEAGAGAIESIRKVISKVSGGVDFDKFSKEIKNITSSVNNPIVGNSMAYADPMNPYNMLYSTLPTGFKYILPYMQNTYIANQGSFGTQADGGVLIDALTKYAEIGKEALQTINLNKTMAPGRMVEEPKAFTFTGREKSYTCSFPLLNTRDYAEVVKNWQFIYLLSYQNTPNRVSRDLIDPPCIYEAYIPGIWYSRYAALTNMTVDFVGARREMYIPVHTIDHAQNGNRETATGNWQFYNKKALAVIPDAYQVTLTFTELFSETQNFKYQMLRESMNDIISTGEML